jgi:hypothetical protein
MRKNLFTFNALFLILQLQLFHFHFSQCLETQQVLENFCQALMPPGKIFVM